MMNRMVWGVLATMLVGLVLIEGFKRYKLLSAERQVNICVMLLATGSMAALSVILLMKPVAMVTVVGSLMEPSNDYLLLPVVIFIVAVINLINGRVKNSAG